MALNKFYVTRSLAREFNKGQDCCKKWAQSKFGFKCFSNVEVYYNVEVYSHSFSAIG